MSQISSASLKAMPGFAQLGTVLDKSVDWLRRFIGVPSARDITTDQMQTVITATPMAMSGHIFNTVIASIALAFRASSNEWIFWSLASLAVGYYVYRRRKIKQHTVPKVVSQRALQRAVAFGFLLALPWGMLPVFFLNPSDSLTMLIIIALVTGMAASGGILLAPVYPAAFSYVTTIMAPSFVALLTLGSSFEYYLLAALSISYAGFLFATISIVARMSISASQSNKALNHAFEKVHRATQQMTVALDGGIATKHNKEVEPTSDRILDTLRLSTKQLVQQDVRIKKSETELSALFDSAMDGIIAIDFLGNVARYNPSAAAMFNLPERNDGAAISVKTLLSYEGWKKLSTALQLVSNQSIKVCNTRLIETRGIRLQGEEFPVEISLAPLLSDNLVTLIVRDITQRKSSETKLLLLMKEVNHRSRNLMAVLSSISAMTAARAKTVEEFNTKFSARMQSLLKSQEIITSDDWGNSDLQTLLKVQINTFCSGTGKRIDASGPTVYLEPKAVQNLGLAFHELATNSAKYGGLSKSGGHVEVRWRPIQTSNNKALVVVWREVGGPKVTPPSRRGFGSKLLRNLIGQDLAGKGAIKYREAGLVWQAVVGKDYFKVTRKRR